MPIFWVELSNEHRVIKLKQKWRIGLVSRSQNLRLSRKIVFDLALKELVICNLTSLRYGLSLPHSSDSIDNCRKYSFLMTDHTLVDLVLSLVFFITDYFFYVFQWGVLVFNFFVLEMCWGRLWAYVEFLQLLSYIYIWFDHFRLSFIA